MYICKELVDLAYPIHERRTKRGKHICAEWLFLYGDGTTRRWKPTDIGDDAAIDRNVDHVLQTVIDTSPAAIFSIYEAWTSTRRDIAPVDDPNREEMVFYRLETTTSVEVWVARSRKQMVNDGCSNRLSEATLADENWGSGRLAALFKKAGMLPTATANADKVQALKVLVQRDLDQLEWPDDAVKADTLHAVSQALMNEDRTGFNLPEIAFVHISGNERPKLVKVPSHVQRTDLIQFLAALGREHDAPARVVWIHRSIKRHQCDRFIPTRLRKSGWPNRRNKVRTD